MPNRRAASRWLSPSTWQAWRTRAYSSTENIPAFPGSFRTSQGKATPRYSLVPPRPDYPAASVAHHSSAALKECGIAWTVSTTAFPITPFSASCRISRSRTPVRPRPPCAGTSRRGSRGDRGTSLRPVDLLARHQRPSDARHLVRERHGHQPDGTPLQDPPGPSPGGTVPVLGPV